eukprot:10010899-Alexandrium_andersonii.AAC.1
MACIRHHDLLQCWCTTFAISGSATASHHLRRAIDPPVALASTPFQRFIPCEPVGDSPLCPERSET